MFPLIPTVLRGDYDRGTIILINKDGECVRGEHPKFSLREVAWSLNMKRVLGLGFGVWSFGFRV